MLLRTGDGKLINLLELVGKELEVEFKNGCVAEVLVIGTVPSGYFLPLINFMYLDDLVVYQTHLVNLPKINRIIN
jgi:hypothetical protein